MRVGDGSPQAFLFDLQSDPHESRNLAGLKDYAPVESALHQQLVRHFQITS